MRLLAAFSLFVSFPLLISAVCSGSTPVECLRQPWNVAELCVSDPSQCPNGPACSPETPFRCWDQTCAATIEECQSKEGTLYSCTLNSEVCWDGSCTLDKSFCPNIPACAPGEIRCPDMSCSKGQACPSYTVCTNNTAEGIAYRTRYAVHCCGASGDQICSEYFGCDVGAPYLCGDYTCETDPVKCQGSCLVKDGVTPLKCFGERKGKCVYPPDSCILPPMMTPIIPTFSEAGLKQTVIDIYANTPQKPKVGWVSIPAFLEESSSNYTIHVLVEAQWPGRFLQVPDQENPDSFVSAIQATSGDDGGPDWASDDRPQLCIFSPLVRIYSPDLGLLAYLNDTATLTEYVRAMDLYRVNITLNVTLPEDIDEDQVCLAYINTTFANDSVSFTLICADDHPDHFEGSTFYSGLVPLTRIAEDHYFAFVMDLRLNDFDDPESTGGGFFALGIALIVVVGIVVLANRENLQNYINNRIGGGA